MHRTLLASNRIGRRMYGCQVVQRVEDDVTFHTAPRLTRCMEIHAVSQRKQGAKS